MIDDGYKFAALALYGCQTNLSSMVDLGDGLQLHATLPFKMDEFGKKCENNPFPESYDTILKSNLVVTALARAKTPGILDDENLQLKQKVRGYLYCLWTVGRLWYLDSHLMTGERIDRHLRVRELGPMHCERFFTVKGTPIMVVGADQVRLAAQLLKVYEFINALAPDYYRLCRGIRCVFKMFGENDKYEAVHQAIRAVEALVYLKENEGASKFAHQCRSLVVDGPGIQEAFETAYKLRSRIEHHRSWDDLFPNCSKEEVIDQTGVIAWKIEAVVRNSYRQVLTSPELLSYFKTAQDFERLWTSADAEKARLWSPRLDLSKLEWKVYPYES